MLINVHVILNTNKQNINVIVILNTNKQNITFIVILNINKQNINVIVILNTNKQNCKCCSDHKLIFLENNLHHECLISLRHHLFSPKETA